MVRLEADDAHKAHNTHRRGKKIRVEECSFRDSLSKRLSD